MTMLQTLRSRFAAALADFTDDPETFAQLVKPAQDARFGDYQANCAMPLAKQQGLNPRDLALRLVDKLEVSDLCEPPEIAGPGFINLTLSSSQLRQRVQQAAADERLGVERVERPRTVIVDFSSPNVAKPMHVGHLRSTVIGDALARTLRFLGHSVITDNHIGDWGAQFGMIIYGYKHFLDRTAYERDAVGELARLYRLVNQLSEYQAARQDAPTLQARAEELAAAAQSLPESSDPKEKKKRKQIQAQAATAESDLQAALAKIEKVERDAGLRELAASHANITRNAREETAKLHTGDAENRALWAEFLPHCLEALQKVYDRLDIRFDLTMGESAYDERLPAVVAELTERGLATPSEGALCVFTEGARAPFIVRKTDGAYTYATTDLATIQYRVRELHAERILYVVDSRQSEHFQALFETARRWDYGMVELRHVSFGTVLGQDNRPYKTRSGDTVGLESLLDEAVAKALEVVNANDDAKVGADGQPRPDLTPEERRRIAEQVGLGGIKYADLMHNRDSDYVFDMDKMLALTGNTATYMQYAHARVHGIFRKGGVDPAALRTRAPQLILESSAERALGLKLSRYGEALEAVTDDDRPNQLTQYLFELANDFTSFFDQCPVLKAPDDATRDSRLLLCDLSGRVIAHGLSLLGIEAPEKM